MVGHCSLVIYSLNSRVGGEWALFVNNTISAPKKILITLFATSLKKAMWFTF